MKRWTILFIFALVLNSCGTNVYDGLNGGNSDQDYIAMARFAVNDSKYDEAAKHLAKVKKHSKEYVLLHVATILGQANFTIWGILSNLLSSSSSSSGSGVNNFFSSLTDSVFGSGSQRNATLVAISNAAIQLQSIPDKDAGTEGLRCFLTGLLVVPAVVDGTQGVSDAITALNSMESNIIGNGSTSDQCPGLSAVQTSLDTLSAVTSDLSYVLAQTSTCPILSFISQSGSLNDVQQRLAKFINTADKGCSNPCASTDATIQAACTALERGCVKAVLSEQGAVAGDGKVSECELVLNCLDGGCF